MEDTALDLVIGEGLAADGALALARGTKLRELVVATFAPRFREAASRGRIFNISTAAGGVTLAAGMATLGAGATSLLSLYNPPGSGFNLSLLRSWVWHVSGTPAAGVWSYWGVGGQVITAAGNAVAGKSMVGGAAMPATGFANAALTGSGAQAFLRPIPSAQFAGAIAATTPGQVAVDEVDGAIEVPPGGLLTIAPPGAGTTHIAGAALEFMCIPN